MGLVGLGLMRVVGFHLFPLFFSNPTQVGNRKRDSVTFIVARFWRRFVATSRDEQSPGQVAIMHQGCTPTYKLSHPKLLSIYI